jgi:hypothetical protein
MHGDHTYRAVLAASEKIHWRVEDLIADDATLDLARPFMPESLARVEGCRFLSPVERRLLNQIRGRGYLHVFGLVEEFILPFVLDHVRPQLQAEDLRVRALLGFAAEEAKHIHLFERFRDAFARSFATPCEVIGPAREVGRAVLAHHPLGVALVILQIEWMTQQHYLDAVRDDAALDPHFASLLRHHWMEEAQHAKLDTLMVEALAAACTPEEVDRAIDDHAHIGALLDAGLAQQVDLDVASLERAARRRFTADERSELQAVQRAATRWTFLGSGLAHPKFLATIGELRPAARARIEESLATFA